jgi:predicted dinucleotide-utilizing enzyme
VTLRVVEPGTNQDVVFNGPALAGARQFPSRLSVAATTALASQHDARVVLIQESGAEREIVLEASGAFGAFSARMLPRPSAEPLSHIVALSLLATLRRFQQPIQVG